MNCNFTLKVGFVSSILKSIFLIYSHDLEMAMRMRESHEKNALQLLINPALIIDFDSYRRQIDITTYQIRKITADTSLCLFADDMHTPFHLGGPLK